MTAIAFHFNVSNPTAYLCKLLRKVHGAGKTAVVLLAPDQVAGVSHALWTFDEAAFLPHATDADPAAVQARSPFLLTHQPSAGAGKQVLINTLGDMPQHYAQFERVLELVSLDEAARQAARQRWRCYGQAGVVIEQFDVAKVAA